MNKYDTIATIIVLLFVFGCCAGFVTWSIYDPEPDWNDIETTRIDNIVTVFMNKPNEFVVFTKDNNELKSHTLISNGKHKYPDWNNTPVRVITDVPKDKNMYVVIRRTKIPQPQPRRTNWRPIVDVEIHIHSDKDIQDGQWIHKTGGKSPITTTGRVIRIAGASNEVYNMG